MKGTEETNARAAEGEAKLATEAEGQWDYEPFKEEEPGIGGTSSRGARDAGWEGQRHAPPQSDGEDDQTKKQRAMVACADVHGTVPPPLRRRCQFSSFYLSSLLSV